MVSQSVFQSGGSIPAESMCPWARLLALTCSLCVIKASAKWRFNEMCERRMIVFSLRKTSFESMPDNLNENPKLAAPTRRRRRVKCFSVPRFLKSKCSFFVSRLCRRIAGHPTPKLLLNVIPPPVFLLTIPPASCLTKQEKVIEVTSKKKMNQSGTGQTLLLGVALQHFRSLWELSKESCCCWQADAKKKGMKHPEVVTRHSWISENYN